MGTEKKSKSGSELPKGSAAPSCKLSALCLPRALLLSGGSPKGVLSSPRAGRRLRVSESHPITPAATSPPASIGSGSRGGSCIKSWHPVPPSPGGKEGGGGSQARGPGGDGGTQLALPCCCGGDHGSREPLGEEWGGGQNPAGMGIPAGLAPLPATAAGARGLSGMGTGRLHGPACGRLWVRVCSRCPGEDGSDFRGWLGCLTVSLHGCSPTDVTQGGSGQI